MYNRVISFLPSPSLHARVPGTFVGDNKSYFILSLFPTPLTATRSPYKSGRHFSEMDFELPDYYAARRKSLSASKYRAKNRSILNLIKKTLKALTLNYFHVSLTWPFGFHFERNNRDSLQTLRMFDSNIFV